MPKEKTNLEGVNVLLGVTGAVAVYKAVDLASKLTAAGAQPQNRNDRKRLQIRHPEKFRGGHKFTGLYQHVDGRRGI